MMLRLCDELYSSLQYCIRLTPALHEVIGVNTRFRIIFISDIFCCNCFIATLKDVILNISSSVTVIELRKKDAS
jgi:hypothetical protein